MIALLNSNINAEGQPWYFYVGIVAAVLIAVFSMPQLIKTVKTKNTESVSLWMLLLLVVGDFCFGIQGLAILLDKALIEQGKNISTGLPLFLANVISCTSSAIVLFFKIRNMRWAKKRGITEAQLAQQYGQIKTEIKQERLNKKIEKQKKKDDAKKAESSPTPDNTQI